MLLAILSICSKQELAEEGITEEVECKLLNFIDGVVLLTVVNINFQICLVSEQEQRKMVIRNKIKAVGRMARVFATLRQEKESIAELKNVLGVEQLPPGTLALGSEGIKQGCVFFLSYLLL